MNQETTRVDKWLWSVRVYKTRTQAGDACHAGRVKVNGEVAKAATKIRVGDEVVARRRDRTIVYGVVKIIEKRVSPALAAAAIEDRSLPAPAMDGAGSGGWSPPAAFAVRDRGAGRPTKRDRRELDRLRTGERHEIRGADRSGRDER